MTTFFIVTRKAIMSHVATLVGFEGDTEAAYAELSEEEKADVDAMVAKVLKAQGEYLEKENDGFLAVVNEFNT